MYSIGDLVDKLVIENIKIYNIREKLHIDENLSDQEYVELYVKMMAINDNRTIISNMLNDKIIKVASKQDPNVALKIVKSYEKND
jgi:hypothetical protein